MKSLESLTKEHYFITWKSYFEGRRKARLSLSIKQNSLRLTSQRLDELNRSGQLRKYIFYPKYSKVKKKIKIGKWKQMDFYHLLLEKI